MQGPSVFSARLAAGTAFMPWRLAFHAIRVIRRSRYLLPVALSLLLVVCPFKTSISRPIEPTRVIAPVAASMVQRCVPIVVQLQGDPVAYNVPPGAKVIASTPQAPPVSGATRNAQASSIDTTKINPRGGGKSASASTSQVPKKIPAVRNATLWPILMRRVTYRAILEPDGRQYLLVASNTSRQVSPRVSPAPPAGHDEHDSENR